MRAEDRDDDIEPDDMLPSVEMTMRFLALSDPYVRRKLPSPRLARRRRSGVPGLPVRDDCPAWNAPEMKAAVEYLQEAGAGLTESAGEDR